VATRTVSVYQSQFNYTVSVQTFAVPAGASSISVDAYVESWSTNFYSGREGKGGRLQANLTVTPVVVINIYVGGSHYYIGSGCFGCGWYGGGGAVNNDDDGGNGSSYTHPTLCSSVVHT